MGGRPWTAKERNQLLLYWGSTDISVIAKWFNRSPKAIEHVARGMGLSTVRETETLAQFTRRTGYTDKQVLKAVKALHMNLHRKPRVSVPRRGLAKVRTGYGAKGQAAARAITEEQGELIVGWLREQTQHCWRLQSGGKVRDGVWGVGRKPERCLECGTTERPHVAKGLCDRCYDHARHCTPEARQRSTARQRELRAWRKAGKPGLPPRVPLPIAAPRVPQASPATTPRPHPLSRIGRPRLALLATVNG